MEKIDSFIQYIGEHKSIWYATNIEIHDYMEAYRKLIFSMEGNIVHNPTDEDIFFERDEQLFHVEVGKTILIK